ncbi:Fur family transcriptional regulator [Micrococcus porci]|uniref:Fur family transcriptional regulator n=1 Tax=Micrococcus porci TaxID=2856555 RepID=UPI003CF4E317
MSTVTVEQPEESALLRTVGLRVTRPRVAVLQGLRRHPHADAGSLLSAVREDLPQVSHQAVYDCLHVLTDAGLVRSLQPAGSPARYELAAHDNHHHLVCRGCGDLVDVPCQTGVAPCLHAPEDHGFLIEEAEVYYWGLCPDCRSGGSTTTSDGTPAPAPPAP